MPQNLDGAMELLAAELDARLEELMDEIAVRLREEVPELAAAEQPELWEPWRDGTRAATSAAVDALGRGRALPARLPSAVGEAARLSARSGIPLSVLLRTYRTGHAVILESWLAAAETRIAQPAVRVPALQVGSRFMFRFVDRLSALVAEEYAAEHDRSRLSREQQRAQLVRDLLAGASIDGDALGYPLTSHHVGVVAWGADPESCIRRLAADRRCRALTVPVTPTVAWGWLAVDAPNAARPPGGALAGVEPLDGTAIALGSPGVGAEGFRRTHRDARLAHSVALKRRRRVTRYDDVALEALALRDEVLAREFAARELGPLAANEPREQRLRHTLRSYFAASQNAAAAAAALGVHERTVANRLRVIEDRLGCVVGVRRAELETALRLHAMFEEADAA